METGKKAFRAMGKSGGRTEATPRAAALAYFEAFPTSRKCDVTEGTDDGHFFTVSYGRASTGDWPRQWKEVTKKTAAELPEA